MLFTLLGILLAIMIVSALAESVFIGGIGGLLLIVLLVMLLMGRLPAH